MTTIIRVEHPSDGAGIFVGRNKGHEINGRGLKFTASFDYHPWDLGDIGGRHHLFPIPADDSIDNFIAGKHFCAYKTIEQIQQWITKDEFHQLFDYGFRVYMIDVSECQIGKYQVIYDKNDIIQQKDISSLFK